MKSPEDGKVKYGVQRFRSWKTLLLVVVPRNQEICTIVQYTVIEMLPLRPIFSEAHAETYDKPYDFNV